MDKPQPNSLSSGVTSKTYASFAQDIILTTAIPTNTPNNTPTGVACRRIRVSGAGAITVKYQDGSQDTITNLFDGETIEVQAVAILNAGTTVTGCTVYW
jgi:hypothetical protein